MQGDFYPVLCRGVVPQLLLLGLVLLGKYGYSHILAEFEVRVDILCIYAINAESRNFEIIVCKHFFDVFALLGRHFFVRFYFGIFPADKLTLCHDYAVDFHFGSLLNSVSERYVAINVSVKRNFPRLFRRCGRNVRPGASDENRCQRNCNIRKKLFHFLLQLRLEPALAHCGLYKSICRRVVRTSQFFGVPNNFGVCAQGHIAKQYRLGENRRDIET